MEAQNDSSPGHRRPISILSLTPPSPILAPSYSNWSSAEIPIFLFEPTDSDEVDFNRISLVSSGGFDLPSSDSFDTILSAGTFGQFRRAAPKRLSRPSQDGSLKPSNGSQDSDSETRPTHRPDLEQVKDTPMPGPPSTAIHDLTFPLVPSPTISLYSTLSGTGSERDTRANSPLKSRPSSYSDNGMDLRYFSNSLLNRDSAFSLPITSPSVQIHITEDPPAIQSLESLPLTVTPSPSHTSIMSPRPDIQLPMNLNWMKDIIVDILIDQEGFRSVSPSFRLVGYSDNTRTLDPSGSVEGGVAEFMPLKRQTFHFHYGPFDGMPILRRITVDRQSRDYISRQATLSVKSNGVYTVRGVETSHIVSPNPQEPQRLRWKFDYLVDDRRGSGSLEGEKTFTPLTFSCSPLLLHPLQGKKIRLIQVVKKSVVTKLVAEKMEPPRNPTNLAVPSLPQTSQPLSRALPSPIRIKSAAALWMSHRRAQSHTPRQPSTLSPSRPQSPAGSPLRKASNSEVVIPTTRRRRASSAGERRLVDVDDVANWKTQTAKENNPLLGQHILPPSKLTLLLEQSENQLAECNRGLSPPPRPRSRPSSPNVIV
ncbi:hypothetical protein D9758_002222 [Tetrapyrgos nigripes]|uniref:Uncharacterized protein n=1 Tax=Tetrapyrgos nigripes TaxID=182062 RepID=A0A8H5GPD7_9AGAR|nr:hypothetical protein D9758_002222 [Tetrapyrgos nigripes]